MFFRDNNDVVFIDVCEKEEHVLGFIFGAIFIFCGFLEEEIEEVVFNCFMFIVVYCVVGTRSVLAV